MSKINIVQIQAAIGLPLTAEFITKTLGIEPNPELTVKRAVFWDANKYGVIVGRLSNYLGNKGAVDPTKFSPDRPKKAEDAPAGDAAKTGAAADSGDGFSFGDETPSAGDADGFSFGDETPAADAAKTEDGFSFGDGNPDDAGFFG